MSEKSEKQKLPTPNPHTPAKPQGAKIVGEKLQKIWRALAMVLVVKLKPLSSKAASVLTVKCQS